MVTRFTYGDELVSALSDPTRVKIVRILTCGEGSSQDLEKKLEIPQEILKTHLDTLLHASLLSEQKNDGDTRYEIKHGADSIIHNFLKNNDIPGDADFCALHGIKTKD